MGIAEKADPENDLLVEEDDSVSHNELLEYDDLQDTSKPKIWLPSFLIGDLAVAVLFVATLACLFGLSRQLILLWRVSQEGSMLERVAAGRT